MQEIFSSKKITRIDGQCNNCGTSELLRTEKDIMKFYLNHQGHTVNFVKLKPRKQRKQSIFTKDNAMIPKRCWNCKSDEIQTNWKMQMYYCKKCNYGGTISYAVNPKEWKKWKKENQK